MLRLVWGKLSGTNARAPIIYEVPIVAFLSFLIGAVLALNGASQLRQFGAAIYIADLVGVSMTREMAPLITWATALSY